jgi:hypothetical protein
MVSWVGVSPVILSGQLYQHASNIFEAFLFFHFSLFKLSFYIDPNYDA